MERLVKYCSFNVDSGCVEVKFEAKRISYSQAE